MYVSKGWSAVEEHLYDVLGRLCREAGAEQAAADFFLRLLQQQGRARGAQASHHYMSQFVDLMARIASKVSKGVCNQ